MASKSKLEYEQEVKAQEAKRKERIANLVAGFAKLAEEVKEKCSPVGVPAGSDPLALLDALGNKFKNFKFSLTPDKESHSAGSFRITFEPVVYDESHFTHCYGDLEKWEASLGRGDLYTSPSNVEWFVAGFSACPNNRRRVEELEREVKDLRNQIGRIPPPWAFGEYYNRRF